MLYAPDILKNADAYQHLPGILKFLGYYSAQFTHSYFADAYSMNMLSAFDIANGRMIGGGIYGLINNIFTSDYAYFIYQVCTRVTDRLGHISFLSQMTSNEALVEGEAQTFSDEQKVDDILKILADAKQPVFIDLHWLGTHGPTFKPARQIFSAGKDAENQGKWDTDFYDDSILAFDAGIAQIINYLQINGKFNDTMIIEAATMTSYGRPPAGYLC